MKEIRFVDIQELKNNPDNPRIIKDESFKRLKKKLKEFPRGLELNPIIVNDQSFVICGNQRLRALKELGIKKVPILLADDFTEEELEKFAILDNVNDGEWDWDILSSSYDIEQLEEWGLPIPEDMKIPEEDIDGSEDEIPEEPKDIYVELSDVWKCGRHTVVCGDAGEVDMKGIEPVLMVTDPPYGVEYEPEWRKKAGVSKNQKKMGRVQNDDRTDWSKVYANVSATVAYVWHNGCYAKEFQQSLEAVGYEIVCQIIWNKERFALGRGDYHWKHEPCWYAVKKGQKHNWQGARNQSTVWDINSREDSGHGHGTQKPLQCMMIPIQNNSKKGDVVCDPFLGSGTTLIACERLNRTCYGIELEPKYVQVILQRYYNETGDVPLCENRAVTFKPQE